MADTPSALQQGKTTCDLASELRAYYAGSQFEYGFPSLCKMTLPDDLAGKTVLDVGCRRGKGVFKLSERVGAQGRVIGADWSPAFIAEAKRRMDRAWQDTGLPSNNMEFHVAYPEDLSPAGVEDASVDAVFINSVCNLAFDLSDTLRELFRVLRPGGLLINETVLADCERDANVVAAARAVGNSVQAAPSKRAYEALLASAGFGTVRYHAEAPVCPSAGALPDRPAETVESTENVHFTALVATVAKP